MILSKIFKRREKYNLRAIAVLLVLTASTTLSPLFAAAAQVTTRSIALSSSSKAASDVTYNVGFTAVGAAGAFVLQFCQNSPVIPDTCTAPTGFDDSLAASTTTGFTDVTAETANELVVAGTITGAQAVSVAIKHIDNPTASGPIYARIVSYDSKAHAIADYSATDLVGSGSASDVIDQGGLAISITDTVGVSGLVMESMTFCVSAAAITADCAATTAPVIQLGETVGDTKALIASAVSTGVINTQISTNAASGAVISLKSNATGCGGLIRAGAPAACDIAPALTSGIAAGEAKFGVKTGAVSGTGSAPTGTLEPVSGSGYGTSAYALNYVTGDATGVTSVYGDPFLDTNNAPINNKNMPITFGASVTNSTPAGLYSTDISLLATGKF